MNYQPFGQTGFQTFPIAFGAMRIEANERGYSSPLLHALERGINFVDTARNYGQSEEVVARTLKEWRGEQPFIATKVKPLDVANWRFYVPLEEQFTPESIRASVETSLTTLGIDCIDLIQLHQWYYLWSHRPEWLESLLSLQSEGKVRFIGVSAQDHEHDAILPLIDNNVVDAVQIFFNAFESRPRVSALPLAQQCCVGVIGRCTFDHSGSLATGGNRETLAEDIKLANASKEIVTEYLNRIDRLRSEFCDGDCSLAELSIRFALSHPGMSNLAISLADESQVDAAIVAADRGPLPQEIVERITKDHVWVKNFYYFSRRTVDGNSSQ
ncbi:MAG: aldo/keto reductase [Verrucomicrobiota bacterium]